MALMVNMDDRRLQHLTPAAERVFLRLLIVESRIGNGWIDSSTVRRSAFQQLEDCAAVDVVLAELERGQLLPADDDDGWRLIAPPRLRVIDRATRLQLADVGGDVGGSGGNPADRLAGSARMDGEGAQNRLETGLGATIGGPDDVLAGRRRRIAPQGRRNGRGCAGFQSIGTPDLIDRQVLGPAEPQAHRPISEARSSRGSARATATVQRPTGRTIVAPATRPGVGKGSQTPTPTCRTGRSAVRTPCSPPQRPFPEDGR